MPSCVDVNVLRKIKQVERKVVFCTTRMQRSQRSSCHLLDSSYTSDPSISTGFQQQQTSQSTGHKNPHQNSITLQSPSV